MSAKFAFFVFALVLQGLYSYEVISAREPPYKEYAKMARYIVHKVSWTAMGTISTEATLPGFPMVNVISMADSPLNEPSTGKIYFMLTDLDFTGQDLRKTNKLTTLFSMEQYKNCSDPMEPTCARVMVAGKMDQINWDHEEFPFAKSAMVSRHPNAVHWNQTHSFYLARLDIQEVIVLDFYGGPHYVTPEDYYAANDIDPESMAKISRNFV